MKKKWKIILGIVAIIIIGVVWFVNTPVDIRPASLKKKIAKADYEKGEQLIKEMQDAYGGMDNWLAHQTATYAQVADWYGDQFGLSNWDTMPQAIQITSVLGTDNSELTILNGPAKGKRCGVEAWKYYVKEGEDKKSFVEQEKYMQKLMFKNYWFQFPFRISEAPIIAYAGEDTVDGETYDLVYATWGSEAANRDYDQYILYLDKKTRLVEWLYFTVREKFKFLHATNHFTDFRTVNGIVVPFNQFVTGDAPNSDGPKLHENRYQWVQFGTERVDR